MIVTVVTIHSLIILLYLIIIFMIIDLRFQVSSHSENEDQVNLQRIINTINDLIKGNLFIYISIYKFIYRSFNEKTKKSK